MLLQCGVAPGGRKLSVDGNKAVGGITPRGCVGVPGASSRGTIQSSAPRAGYEQTQTPRFSRYKVEKSELGDFIFFYLCISLEPPSIITPGVGPRRVSFPWEKAYAQKGEYQNDLVSVSLRSHIEQRTDGNKKGRKKYHLFPSSLREIAVIISAASHF